MYCGRGKLDFQSLCIILHAEFTTRVINISSLAKCYTIPINVFDIRKIKYSKSLT